MIGTNFLLAFTTGLLGGFGHCLGMCGPLVASYALHDRIPRARLLPHLLYNAGRVTTYSFIGSLMGLTGTFVDTAGRLAGVQNTAAIVTGVLMIVMGMRITGLLGGTGFIEQRSGLVLRAVKAVIETDSPSRYFPLGLLLGLLPCGLSLSVFIGAAGAGGMLQGMCFVFCFGLGTVPALLLLGVVITYLNSTVRTWLHRASGVMVSMSGVFFLLRGISSHV